MNNDEFMLVQRFLENYSGKLHAIILKSSREAKFELRLIYRGDFVGGKYSLPIDQHQYLLIPIEETK